MMVLDSFQPTSNAADWAEAIEVTDADTGTALPLGDYLIEMEIMDQRRNRRVYGSSTDGTIATTSTGFEFSFPASSMRDLRAGSYTVNIRFTDSVTGAVLEPVIANLPVIEGGF